MSTARAAAVPIDRAGNGARDGSDAAVRSLDRRALIRAWAGPVLVLVVAAVARLFALGVPAHLVFDETYYVKDAWTLLHLGYEGSWPAKPAPDPIFESGRVDTYSSDPSYAAHPPLGKWIIALGEVAAGGAKNPFGWRLSVAVVGILAVALLMVVAHRMFRTSFVTTVAGGLFAIDNQAIVMSRVGLLDNMVMFFALGAFACLLEDRYATERRFGAWLLTNRRGIGDWGPALWRRPWLVGAGVLLGVTTAVKWSGIYFLAAFLLYTVAADLMLRRRAGVRFWALGGVLKQGPISAVTMVPIALVAYLAGWTGWFVTGGGYDRQYVQDGGHRFTGLLAWVPTALQNLWAWHASIYAFHTGLDTPHPYKAPAILWPLIARPTSMYYVGTTSGQGGCRFSSCSEAITDLPNPLIWYAGVAAAIYLIVRFARRREWQAGLILLGFVGGYLPWLMYPDRTMFFFYSIAFEPYLILGLAAVIGLMVVRPAGADSPDEIIAAEARYGLKVRRGIIGGFLGVALVVSVFFYPLDTAMQTPYWFWHIHMWSPTWI